MLFRFDEIREATGGTLLNPPQGEGVDSITTDSRLAAPNSLFLAIAGEQFDGHDFLEAALKQGARLLCVERSRLSKLPPGAPAIVVDSTIRAYQNLARFHRLRFPVKAIALTGSSGKTSVKEMLRAIFNRAYGAEHVLATEGNTNNQIGVPQNLLRLTGEHKICILECGTNHHGEIEPLSETIRPDAALIVSIGRCHLEYLGSLEGVAAEKSTIFRHLSPEGVAVIPLQTPGFDIMKQAAGNHTVLCYGKGANSVMEAVYRGGNITGSSFELIDHRTGETVVVNWGLSGKHQAANAAGAAAVATAFGIPLREIAEGLAGCVLPGMRMKITRHGDAQWINDAYNANPDSMHATLEWLGEFADPAKLLLVLGDMREVGESSGDVHREVLKQALRTFPGARIAAVGPEMTRAAEELNEPRIQTFPDSTTAAERVRQMVRPGDLVFLKASRGTRLERIEP